MLRFITYLAPSLPEDLFAAVAGHVGRALGEQVTLAVEPSMSGPPADGDDPFSTGTADVGFMCAPSFLALSAMRPPPVVAMAAPVFGDGNGVARGAVYFSDIVVHRTNPARSIAALADAGWGYNDAASWSGYHALGGKVDLSRALHTGSHLRSLELVASGAIDAAAIDSIVLALRRRADPALDADLRVVDRLGPFPVQPVVGAAALPDGRRAGIAEALVSMHHDEAVAADLSRFGLERFVPVTLDDYAGLLDDRT